MFDLTSFSVAAAYFRPAESGLQESDHQSNQTAVGELSYCSDPADADLVRDLCY